MTNALTRAIEHCEGIASAAFTREMQRKDAVASAMAPSSMGGLDEFRKTALTKERLSQFRGWVFSPIHALATLAGKQPVCLGRMTREAVGADGKRKRPAGSKARLLRKMPPSVRAKAESAQDWELVTDDAWMWQFEKRPNPLQFREQFVYTAVASLNLTGIVYIVQDETKDGLHYYALPSTWVRPVETDKEGLYSKFRVVDPSKPESAQEDSKPLDRSQVGFAFFPNPADPRVPVAPISSNTEAVTVDGQIQQSQQAFFANAPMPSVAVKIGRRPDGRRERLDPAQRRQIYSAIGRDFARTSTYGLPMIIDGFIEDIVKLSLTGRDMGWERLEESVKKRILSVFGLHPLFMGEDVDVGGHAQAYVIKEIGYERINCMLDMLGGIMTEFAEQRDPKLFVWWEPCRAVDLAERNKLLVFGAGKGWLTQDEFRAELGYGPMEVDEEEEPAAPAPQGEDEEEDEIDQLVDESRRAREALLLATQPRRVAGLLADEAKRG